MEVRSIYRYAKISPFKVREVTREIQGLSVSAALDLLAFTPKKAAFLIGKTLKSAVANAENNANMRVDALVVKEAIVGEGPTMKRMMPRARGSGSRILKRSSHIRIILSDEIPINTRVARKARAEQEKKAAKKEAKDGEGAEKSTPTAEKKQTKPKKSGKAKSKK
jgi:large subunit ribosomal protein L22